MYENSRGIDWLNIAKMEIYFGISLPVYHGREAGALSLVAA